MPDDRHPLPGENEHAFQTWRSHLLTKRSVELRAQAHVLRRAMSAERWAPSVAPDDAALEKARAAVVATVRKRLSGQAPSVPKGWLRKEPTAGPDAFAYYARAGEIVAIGARMLGSGGSVDGDARAFLDIAFGYDALHIALGDFLGATPFFNDPPLPPPGGFGAIEDLLKSNCVHGIGRALTEFGLEASRRPRTWSTGTITGVAPKGACHGATVTIQGTGFGATQPQNVEVFFSAASGGCVAAEVVAWSDTEITVVVPPGAGHGCVGLIEHQAGSGAIFQAADTLAGEIESCLGLAGFAAAQDIRQLGSKVGSTCPKCDDPARAFNAGPPVIDFFVADGQTVGDVTPGGTVDLFWSVIGADTVTIASDPAGSLPPVPGPVAPDRGQTQTAPLPLQDGQRGTYVLRAVNACGTVRRALDVVCRGSRALVFSGGGAKGAFEVGAARCLYDAGGVRPEILSGASVGALNAAKLAEGPQALADLEALWLGLLQPDDFYLKPGWFRTLDPMVQGLLSGGSSNIGGAVANFVTSWAAKKIIGSYIEAMGIPGILYSIVTSLYPVVTTVIDVARLVDAAVRASNANALFDPTPLVNLVTANVDPPTVAASGIRLRVTTVSLETARAEVVTERGNLLSTGHALPLREVLVASASIPVAFPPVAISGTSRGTEHFVDGGTRENVPIRAAVRAGADRVYAISLSPLELPLATGFGQAKLPQIAPRAFELLLDEMQLDDIAPFRGFGVPLTVAAPTFLVHDTLTVDPGLIAINMAYGYMRAYDDLVAPLAERKALRASTDEIILGRLDAWGQEHYANGERMGIRPAGSPLVLVPDPMALQDVRDSKLAVRTATKARVARWGAASVPSGTITWWQEFERHVWQPFIPNPWASLTSSAGQLGAVPVPGP